MPFMTTLQAKCHICRSNGEVWNLLGRPVEFCGGSGGGGGTNGEDYGGDTGDEPPRREPEVVLWALVVGACVSSVAMTPSPSLAKTPKDDDTSVSVIIPALNEAESIGATVRHLRNLEPAALEVIVVDGGSSDATPRLAAQAGAKVIRAKPDARGRARQMNLGASHASGDILCFVHADTCPPLDLVQVVGGVLTDTRVACGGFVPVIQHGDRTFWFISLHNVIKTYYPALFRPVSFFRGLRCLFGDQVMFCRRREFDAVGGFDARYKIMEDIDLCFRMHELPVVGHRRRRVRLVNRVVTTSGRRFEQWGNLKATILHLYLGFSWYFGASPEQLNRDYVKLYGDIR
ncbi:hypothetical protein CYMTET_19196 [Cymbomonas tetramitiformis]|uniref:Glycosyltransferase 2-like domain-containing protein n=1 Tax=Cymbomonas tetramitiformis TaxID=36881 RepID=A0AAE0G7T8_9CHLO|nr:hypothetical protein CYMTET_19196 [Cymbomonas tetramitiformis]